MFFDFLLMRNPAPGTIRLDADGDYEVFAYQSYDATGDCMWCWELVQLGPHPIDQPSAPIDLSSIIL